MQLSHRVRELSESQTIAMARRSRELLAQGIDVISLSLGEPDFFTPDSIKNAACEAIRENYSFYTHVSGYLELRKAICTKFLRDNQLQYQPEEIVVSTGAKQSIANVLLCLLNPGDEVIVPAPYWVSYLELIKLTGAVAKVIPTYIGDNFKLTAEALSKNITPKTRCIIFSSPCNPTGSVYSEKELSNLAKVVLEHPELYVVSDEIYEHILFSGTHTSMAHITGMKERTAIINGVSKGFAMTGWRGGIMAAPDWLAKACDKMQGQFTSATSSITQKAMHAAMLLDPATTHPMRDAFQRRRDLVVQGLKKIKGFKCNIPDGAFYVFPEVSGFFGKKGAGKLIQNATDLCMYFLDVAQVALVPGSAFGDDRYLRLSYATSDEKLKDALHRIEKAVHLLTD